MAEPKHIVFKHREVVEALIKHQGLHEGVWMLTVTARLNMLVTGPSPDTAMPAAMVLIQELGLMKTDQENSLAVDAAAVNPYPR